MLVLLVLFSLWSGDCFTDEGKTPTFVAHLGNEQCPWSEKLRQELPQIEKNYPCQKLRSDRSPKLEFFDEQAHLITTFEAVPPLSEIERTLATYREICLDEVRDLKSLYTRARLIGCQRLVDHFLSLGLAQKEGIFFHLEKLATLAEQNLAKTPEAKELKNEILKRDPKNKEGSHLVLALLEFQEKKKSKRCKAHDIVRPLIQYLSEESQK
jgi:hypothetical protein